jgi:hypothetical protein
MQNISLSIRHYIEIILTLPVPSYGSETWFLILWEEHRLRVSENIATQERASNRARDKPA